MTMVEDHQVQLNRLTSIAERAQTLSEKLEAQADETRQDAQDTKRIWIWLCKRFGLPEDEDPKGPWDDPLTEA